MSSEAHPGVQHHGHQERRLAIGEAVEADSGDALVPRHSKSSSAVCGTNGGLPPSALAPPSCTVVTSTLSTSRTSVGALVFNSEIRKLQVVVETHRSCSIVHRWI